MQHLAQKKGSVSSFCCRRRNVFFIAFLCLLLLLVLIDPHNTNSIREGTPIITTTAPPPTIHSSNTLRDCIVPDSYAPTGPGTCVMTADGSMQVVPGVPAPPQLPWKSGECEATLSRFAPWLHQTRQDIVAAPTLICSVDGKTYNDTPLFVVEKQNKSYKVTEPLWASLSTIDNRPKGNSTVKSEADCPTLYLTCHTESLGQTFNTVQRIVNTIWLAKKLNRTYVIPPLPEVFQHEHLKSYDANGTAHVPFEWYFDLTRLREAGYCFISYSDFEKEMRERWPDDSNREMIYYGPRDPAYVSSYVVNDTMDVAPRIAPPTGGAPPTPLPFHVTFEKMSQALPTDREVPDPLPDVPFIMVESAVSIFMYSPMTDAMEIYGLLDPSETVAAYVEQVLLRSDTSRPNFALHLRYREGACKGEQRMFYHDLLPENSLSSVSLGRSDEGMKSVLDECTYTADYILRNIKFALHHNLTYTGEESVSVFLATDNQRPEEITKLKEAFKQLDYVLFTSDDLDIPSLYGTPFAKKVFGVVVDYFLLLRADVFLGNRMSSISQCVSMARLGQGRACHAVSAGFLRGVFYPNMHVYS